MSLVFVVVLDIVKSEREREKIDVTDLTPEENEKQAKELSF